jgi:hypothetical protein
MIPHIPAVRVTHRNEGLVRRAFPLQLTVMRAVAERELGRSMDAVYQEARRRANAVAGTELNAETDSAE